MKNTDNNSANNQLTDTEAAFREIDRLKDLEEEDSFEEKSYEQSEEELISEDEEIEETSNEDEREEEGEEEELKTESVKKPEKAWKERKRRFKAQAETRIALEEKRLALEENAYLKDRLSQAEAAGTFQYSKNAYSELEKAKNLQRKAIDEGDADGVIEAGMGVSRALHNIMELEKWATYENAQPKKEVVPPPAQQQQQQELEWQVAQEWISTHRELQPNSRSYDQELAEEVAEYIYEFDSELDDSGKSSLKYSPQYFNDINSFIKDFQKERRAESTKKNIGSIGNVGSVRNSYNTSLQNISPKPQKISLTALEKDLARTYGISEEEWAKQKSNVQKNRNNI